MGRRSWVVLAFIRRGGRRVYRRERRRAGRAPSKAVKGESLENKIGSEGERRVGARHATRHSLILCAAGGRSWHKLSAEGPSNVGVRGQRGRHHLGMSISHFDLARL
jgi:hypothetical protein